MKGGQNVAEKFASKDVVTFQELLMSNVIEQEALINLLEAKGIIRKAELLEEIKKLKGRRRRVRMKWPW